MVVLIELIVLTWFLYLSKRDLKKVFRVNKSTIIQGVLMGLVYALVVFLSKQIPLSAEIINQFINGIQLQSFVLYLIYPLAIAVAEEFVFRYFVTKKLGVFPSAILFTVLHYRPNFPFSLFAPIFLLALSQSWLFNKTKSLVPPIIAHLFVTYSILLM